MDISLFLFLFCFASTVSADATICASNPDGHYEIACRSYLQCTGGIGVTINCPDPPATNTLYNNKTGMCDNPENVGPPCNDWRDCSASPDKKYADVYNGCKSYYTCHNKKYYGHQFCSGDLVFDEAMQICNWKWNVPPPCGTKS